ncbi:MAG: DUF58 domain-containing protein [Acidimicrobiales bacterium]
MSSPVRGAGSGPGAAAALGLTPDILQALERLTIPSRRTVLGASAGQRRSRRYGSSLDLADYRAYVPGDDIRRLDWCAYARLGRLFVRLYSGEEDACVSTWVDASASMAWDREHKGRPARAVAGALAFLALAAEDRAACLGFAGAVLGRAGPVRGKRSAPVLWSALAGMPEGTETDWTKVAGAARSVPRGVAVVVSDFLSEVASVRPAVSALRSAGNEVVLVQVLSPEDLRPSVRGELRLVDSETARAVEVTMSQAALDAYHAARQAHSRELAAMAGSYDARLVSVDGGTPLRQLLLGQLVRARVAR